MEPPSALESCLDLRERGLSETAVRLKAQQAICDFNHSSQKNLLRVGPTRVPIVKPGRCLLVPVVDKPGVLVQH